MTEVSPCLRATNKTPINFLHLEAKWSKGKTWRKSSLRYVLDWLDHDSTTVAPLLMFDWVDPLAEYPHWSEQYSCRCAALIEAECALLSSLWFQLLWFQKEPRAETLFSVHCRAFKMPLSQISFQHSSFLAFLRSHIIHFQIFIFHPRLQWDSLTR